MLDFRSDMANEVCDEYVKEYSRQQAGMPDGIEYEKKKCGGFEVENVKILDEQGEKILEMPRGEYITMRVGHLWLTDYMRFKSAADELSKIISSLVNTKGSVLVVGLGNRYVTPDAVGAIASSNVIATRHLKDNGFFDYENSGLGEVSTVTPGVLGQTGIEAVEQIKGAVERVKPDTVILVDALASKCMDNLASTVQITNAGIRPGSGVGNDRGELSEKVLGVPTVAVGVPTVIDVATLARDLLIEAGGEHDELLGKIKKDYKNHYVTVKDADEAVSEVGRLIGYAVNKAFHKILSYEEMMYM